MPNCDEAIQRPPFTLPHSSHHITSLLKHSKATMLFTKQTKKKFTHQICNNFMYFDQENSDDSLFTHNKLFKSTKREVNNYM